MPTTSASAEYHIKFAADSHTPLYSLCSSSEEVLDYQTSFDSGGFYTGKIHVASRFPPNIEDNLKYLIEEGVRQSFPGHDTPLRTEAHLPYGQEWHEGDEDPFLPAEPSFRCKECGYHTPHSDQMAAHYAGKHDTTGSPDPTIDSDDFPEQEVVMVELGECGYCGDTVTTSNPKRIEAEEEVYCDVSCLNARNLQ